jgi:hypothetical protein
MDLVFRSLGDLAGLAPYTQRPMFVSPATTAVMDDTCGNLSQIASMP